MSFYTEIKAAIDEVKSLFTGIEKRIKVLEVEAGLAKADPAPAAPSPEPAVVGSIEPAAPAPVPLPEAAQAAPTPAAPVAEVAPTA